MLASVTLLNRIVTVIEAPLIPVPLVELHGVATKVWFPNRSWRQRDIKRRRPICLYGAAISFKYYTSRVRVCLRRYRVACSSD